LPGSCRADGDPFEPGGLSLNLVLPQTPVTRSVAVRRCPSLC